MLRRRGYELIAEALRVLKVDVVFGLMGNANLRYLVEWIEGGGDYVGTVGEAAAVGMADGFHRIGRRLGVASVTFGPGLTNTISPLTEAVRARSSLLILSGTPGPRHHRQDINVRSVAELTGAGHVQVIAAEAILDKVLSAERQATAERRPVIVDFGPEAINGEATASTGEPERGFNFKPASIDDGALDHALGIAATARRPIVLAGRGAALAGAREPLVQLADRIGAPLATTLLGRNLFDGHPYNLGVFGTLSNAVAIETIDASDCVIAFGASLNNYTTVWGAHTKGKAIVQCDTDPAALGAHTPVNCGIVGDATEVASAMVEAVDQLDGGRRVGQRTSELRQSLATQDPRAQFTPRNSAKMLDMREAAMALNADLPSDRIVVTDAGRFEEAVWPYLHVERPTDFTHTSNFGCVGLGTWVALGASVASPDRLTVCAAGDGGAAMALMEFITAVRRNLPFVLVVFNDNAYGAEYRYLAEFGLDTRHARLDWPDFADVARVLGGRGVRVETASELHEAARALQSISSPTLIDIQCDPGIDLPRLF